MRLGYRSLDLEAAHAVRALLQLRASGEALEISFHEASEEAQNALLKVLEELPEGTELRIFCPRPETLLPTLLSRGVVERGELAGQDGNMSGDFLTMSAAGRMRLLESEFPKGDTPEEKALLRLQSKEFVRVLELAAAESKDYKVLAELERARAHLDAKELPVRNVLEHLALVLE